MQYIQKIVLHYAILAIVETNCRCRIMVENGKRFMSIVDGNPELSNLPTEQDVELKLWELCQHDDPAIAVQALDTMVKWKAFKRGIPVNF